MVTLLLLDLGIIPALPFVPHLKTFLGLVRNFAMTHGVTRLKHWMLTKTTLLCAWSLNSVILLHSLNIIISLFYNIINRWLKKPCCKGLSDDCPVPCGVNCVAAVPLLSHFGQDNIQNDSCCVSSDFVVCFLTLHHNFTPCKSSSPSGC